MPGSNNRHSRGAEKDRKAESSPLAVDSEVEAMPAPELVDVIIDENDIDIELSPDPESSPDTPLDFDIVHELVPVADTTMVRKRAAGRELVKMNDQQVRSDDWLLAHRIVHPNMPDYSVMNSFREIRTRLLQKSQGKNFICMVASLNRAMGATFTALNLAAAFAYEGGKTSLLIDCNPRDRQLSEMLDLKDARGLSDYVVDPEMDAMDIIYSVGISRLRLIPFGSAVDSRQEFLGSERMREFMDVLKRRHIDRFIIIDAPPVELSADASILSELADYVLLVVPYGEVTNRRLRRVIKSFPADKIAGIVLNNCKTYA